MSDGVTTATATAPLRVIGVVSVVAVAVAVTVADWSTKSVAAAWLDDRSIEVGSLMTLRLSHNPGVAFGLGDRLPGSVVIAVTAAVTVLVAVAAMRAVLPSRVAAGLVLGGAVANLVDRLIGGTVVDFIDLGWWPSFNLADASLTVGSAFMVLSSIRGPHQRDDGGRDGSSGASRQASRPA